MHEQTRESRRIREYNGEVNKRNDKSIERIKRLFKQIAAVALLICGIMIINRSSFEFGKNCIAALSRAVHHSFDWMKIINGAREYFMTVWRFWSEIF